jgi:ribose transport system permease protein
VSKLTRKPEDSRSGASLTPSKQPSEPGVAAVGGGTGPGQGGPGSPRSTVAVLESLRRKLPGLSHYGMVAVLIVLVIAAQILYSGFLQIGNIWNLLSQNAPIGLVAVGMTFVIIGGGFDLSVSSLFAIGAVVSAGLAGHMSVPLAVLLAVLAGALGGLINGVLITRMRLNSFVVTLATTSVFGGVAYVISNSQPIVPTASSYAYLGTKTFGGVPLSAIVLAVVFVIGGVVLSKTVYGRSVHAVGGNREAARLAGLRVDVIRASTYVLTGVCAALGGVFLASQTNTGSADMGATVALQSIAMVIIGGTSLLGGEGAMWRTLIGILILATINNLLESLAVSTAVQLLAQGLVILLAVSFGVLTRRVRSAS